MGRDTSAQELESEKKALREVLESGVFPPLSNPARLLSYICEKHFEAPNLELTEYDLATGALGRRSDFDPRKDSVVRVEVHRLRKRLKEFYATGRCCEMQIVLPPGKYTPEFLSVAQEEVSAPEHLKESEKGKHSRIKLYSFAAAALIVIAGAILWAARAYHGKPAATNVAVPTAGVGTQEVRLLAGASSGKYIDQFGRLWGGDAYFQGGTAADVHYNRLARTGDPVLYQHARQGFDFRYDIPLQPGIYELRLHFAESSMRVPIVGESGESLRRFRVLANDKQILPPPDARHSRLFDIFSDSGGEDLADVKVFRDIAPASDGKLHLQFVSVKQEALVNAIEIVPGERGRLHPIRLCASNRPIADSHGNVWLADNVAQGGRLSVFNRPISGTGEPELYQGERFGHFTYTIPVAPGRYTVTLGFAENYHSIWDTSGKGARLFNVYINGVQAFRDFDVFAKAGGPLKAITRTFSDVESTPQDKIALWFEPVTESAIVNTVEVIDEGGR